jgi:preprotein translocase subunit SecA
MGMLQKIAKILGGDPNRREVERLAAIVEQINKLEPKYEQLSDDELQSITVEFPPADRGESQGCDR